MIGWIGSGLLILSAYLIGEKRRSGFLVSFAGEFVWIVTAVLRREYDLVLVCVLFAILAAVNFRKWGRNSLDGS